MFDENDIKRISGQYDLEIVQRLDIECAALQRFEELPPMPSLVELSLRKNDLDDISGIESLSNLKRLDLSENKVKDVRYLRVMEGLEYLDLSNNRVDDIDHLLESIAPLQQLYSLSVMNCFAKSVGDVNYEDLYRRILNLLPNLSILDGTLAAVTKATMIDTTNEGDKNDEMVDEEKVSDNTVESWVKVSTNDDNTAGSQAFIEIIKSYKNEAEVLLDQSPM